MLHLLSNREGRMSDDCDVSVDAGRYHTKVTADVHQRLLHACFMLECLCYHTTLYIIYIDTHRYNRNKEMCFYIRGPVLCVCVCQSFKIVYSSSYITDDSTARNQMYKTRYIEQKRNYLMLLCVRITSSTFHI